MKRDFPFPAYPNGWFAVSSSDEVKSGEVKPLDYFGNPLSSTGPKPARHA